MKLLNLELYPRFSLQGCLLRYAELWFSDECISTHITRNRATNGVKEEKERLLDENDYLKELTTHQRQTIQRAKTDAMVHVSLTDEKLKQHSDVHRAEKRLQELQSQIR